MTVDRVRLRELAEKATPGPWEVWADDDDVIGQVVCQMWPKMWKVMRSNAVKPFADTPDVADNAEFIAAARSEVPELLDLLDATEAERDKWKTLTERLVDERDAAVTRYRDVCRLNPKVALLEAIEAEQDTDYDPRHDSRLYTSAECAVAGRLSTMPPFDTSHPSYCLPYARAALEALSEWEPEA